MLDNEEIDVKGNWERFQMFGFRADIATIAADRKDPVAR